MDVSKILEFEKKNKTRQLTLLLNHDPRNSRRSISGQLLLTQPPTSETLDSQLSRAIPRRVITKDSSKDEYIKLVAVLGCKIALTARVKEAHALFGDSGVGYQVVDRGRALLYQGKFRDGFGQAGEDELRV